MGKLQQVQLAAADAAAIPGWLASTPPLRRFPQAGASTSCCCVCNAHDHVEVSRSFRATVHTGLQQPQNMMPGKPPLQGPAVKDAKCSIVLR